MELSDKRIADITKRLLLSRTRILLKFPFYGLLLMHVKFGVDYKSPTAYTNGSKIAFNPDFIDELTDTEVDVVMMHEILHIVLKHCFRGRGLQPERYNIACDIVVNSNIMYSSGLGVESIALKCDADPWRTTPKGKEGYLYTAEEVYAMLPPMPSDNKKLIDSHEEWEGESTDAALEDLWDKRIEDAAEMAKNAGSGHLPLPIEIKMEELRSPKHDWRTILTNFIHEEVNDYSFSPPDRRYEGDFFLPDFNDTDVSVKNILFMIDTSGSMDKKMVTDMYAEISGAIEQFDGKLSGWLGFFDADVVPPQPFDSVDKFKMIRPKGGGGTDFGAIFHYIRKKMSDNLPAAVVILTDGEANFPKVEETMGIPILWVLNTNIQPPYGKIIRV